jgi:hypothetical protein
VPRFFFHVIDDAVSQDDEGLDLPDLEAARAEALAGIREMICGQVNQGYLILHHRVDIEEENGGTVLSLTFGDALTIEP